MKKLLYLLIFYLGLSMNAQQKYLVNFTVNSINSNCNCRDGRPRLYSFNFKTDNNTKVFYSQDGSLPIQYGDSVTWEFELEFGTSKNITFSMDTRSNLIGASRDCHTKYEKTFSVYDIVCASKSYTPPYSLD